MPKTTKNSILRPDTASSKRLTIVKSVNRLHNVIVTEPQSAKHGSIKSKLEREGLYENVIDQKVRNNKLKEVNKRLKT